MPVVQQCSNCAADFKTSPSRVGKVRFCSAECRHAAKHVTVACRGCGTTLEFWRSRPQTFCSQACAQTAIHAPTMRSCIECGGEFRVTPNRATTAKFCSRACTHKNAEFRRHQSAQQQAEKSRRWSGGLYRLREGYVRQKRKRGGHERFLLAHRVAMTEWMLEVDPGHPFLIHDNGTVSLRPDIDVHHKDRRRENNERENLLAVTKQAHAKIHHGGSEPQPWECWPSRLYNHPQSALHC